MSVGKYTPGRRRTNRPRSALRKSARRSPGVSVSRTSTSWEESRSRGVGEVMPLPCTISDIQRVLDAEPVEWEHGDGVVSGWMPTPLPRVTRAPERSGARVTRGSAREPRELAGARGSARELAGAQGSAGERRGAQGSSGQRRAAQGSSGERAGAHGSAGSRGAKRRAESHKPGAVFRPAIQRLTNQCDHRTQTRLFEDSQSSRSATNASIAARSEGASVK